MIFVPDSLHFLNLIAYKLTTIKAKHIGTTRYSKGKKEKKGVMYTHNSTHATGFI